MFCMSQYLRLHDDKIHLRRLRALCDFGNYPALGLVALVADTTAHDVVCELQQQNHTMEGDLLFVCPRPLLCALLVL